jgi:hypothetical protein
MTLSVGSEDAFNALEKAGGGGPSSRSMVICSTNHSNRGSTADIYSKSQIGGGSIKGSLADVSNLVVLDSQPTSPSKSVTKTTQVYLIYDHTWAPDFFQGGVKLVDPIFDGQFVSK